MSDKLQFVVDSPEVLPERDDKLKFIGHFFWRRGWDSNPRNGFPFTAFPVLPVQPLLHLSKHCCPINFSLSLTLMKCSRTRRQTEGSSDQVGNENRTGSGSDRVCCHGPHS